MEWKNAKPVTGWHDVLFVLFLVQLDVAIVVYEEVRLGLASGIY